MDYLRIMGVHCCRHEGVIHPPENQDFTTTFFWHSHVWGNTMVSSLVPSNQRPAGVRTIVCFLLSIGAKLDKSKGELVACGSIGPCDS